MAFGRSSKGIIGRPAKPGEVVNRKAKPVVNPNPNGTRVVGKSKPRQS